MSEIDTDKMIEMARERAGWTVSRAEVAPPAVLDSRLWLVACDVQRENADFIAQSPRAILTLSERVAELEAQIKALTPEPMPPCYRCGGTGSITYFGEGADEGHDIDLNCPVCNPKYERYDDDRDYPEDYD